VLNTVFGPLPIGHSQDLLTGQHAENMPKSPFVSININFGFGFICCFSGNFQGGYYSFDLKVGIVEKGGICDHN